MSDPAPLAPRGALFNMPPEIRLMVYERYCDSIRQDLIKASKGSCNHQQACRRRSYADTMHVIEFQYHQSPYSSPQQGGEVDSNMASDRFVDMKLVSRQMRAEFSPVWLGYWAFQLPRSWDPLSEDLYPSADDPDDFSQMKEFLSSTLANGSKHVKRLRLTRHLRARAEPEKAVQAETSDRLVRLLDQGEGEYHGQLVVHIQIRCCGSWPSNKRASKDALFGRKDTGWKCICDGSTTVSFERGWA